MNKFKIIKRKIKRLIMGTCLRTLIPFSIHQEDYDNGIQKLYIIEKGVGRFEAWKWDMNKPWEHEYYYRLTKFPCKVKKKYLYKYVKDNASLIKSAKRWSEIRNF